MTVEELKALDVYVTEEGEKAVEIYNSLTPEQKEEVDFSVAIVRDDYGDHYVDAAFELPDENTAEEAIKHVEGCVINEVEYHAELRMTYPVPGRFGYDTAILGNVTIG